VVKGNCEIGDKRSARLKLIMSEDGAFVLVGRTFQGRRKEQKLQEKWCEEVGKR